MIEAIWILSQLRRAICILQKFLGNMDTSSKQFLFRRKESILHLHPYCRAIWILFSNQIITAKNRLIGHARSNTHHPNNFGGAVLFGQGVRARQRRIVIWRGHRTAPSDRVTAFGGDGPWAAAHPCDMSARLVATGG